MKIKVLFAPDSLNLLSSKDTNDVFRDIISLAKDRELSLLKLSTTSIPSDVSGEFGKLFHDTNPPKYDEKDLEKSFTAWTNDDERVSSELLELIRVGEADFLISEDTDLIRRSEFSNIEDSVHSIRSLREFLSDLYETRDTAFHRVKDVPLGDIDVKDSFFTSLFGDYGSLGEGFQRWWDKTVKSGRRAWIVKDGDKLAGINIYKDLDTDENSLVPDLGEKPFKICTFKTSEAFRGFKVGELLLKPAFSRAIEIGASSVYLTLFEDKQADLIQFLVKFGFRIASKKKGKESIMYKRMTPPKDVEELPAFDFHRMYSPYFYDDDKISKYIVPIRPGYHAELFPDINPVVEDGEASVTANVPGNTIKKAYLCNSNVTSLEPGSIILFYRSHDKRALTTIGIVEETNLYKHGPSVIKKVTNRTVFSEEQVNAMVTKNKGCVTITFRLVQHLNNFITYDELVSSGALSGPPISITSISNDSYTKLKGSHTELAEYSF